LGRRPPSVETIADFVLWVEDVVERNGGYFRLGGVDFRAVSGGGGGLVYAASTQRILFYDRGFIDYRAVLGERLELLEYGYHHMRADALRCRLDKDPGHEHEDGGPTHLHLPGARAPAPELDFDDALTLVLACR